MRWSSSIFRVKRKHLLLIRLELSRLVTPPVIEQVAINLWREQYQTEDIREGHREDHKVGKIEDRPQVDVGADTYLAIASG